MPDTLTDRLTGDPFDSQIRCTFRDYQGHWQIMRWADVASVK